jgi:hypothetical protein
VRKPVPIRDELDLRITALPGLVRRTSRWGTEPAYCLGQREIAHFHKDGRLDIRLTRNLIRERRAAGGLDPRVVTRGPSSDWVAVFASRPSDLPLVLALVEDAMRANG